MPVDDISEQLALRDSCRRKVALLKTPEERVRDMAALQQRMWKLRELNPAGYAHFMRRNFKARAVDFEGPHDE
jgi:hypothetical protein